MGRGGDMPLTDLLRRGKNGIKTSSKETFTTNMTRGMARRTLVITKMVDIRWNTMLSATLTVATWSVPAPNRRTMKAPKQPGGESMKKRMMRISKHFVDCCPVGMLFFRFERESYLVFSMFDQAFCRLNF